MITEEIKNLMNDGVKDINWECDDLISYFESKCIVLFKNKIPTKNGIKKIHNSYINDFIFRNGFSSDFKIKSKCAKYYLVRGWKESHIIDILGLQIYDYRKINDIISDAELKELYETMSLVELANTLNINYGRLQKHINENIMKTRSITESCKIESTNQKRKKTCVEKYGFVNPSSAKQIKEKRGKTVQEKYGVENVFQSKEIIDKIDKVSFERYGVKRYTQTNEYLLKTKQTSLEKYNVEHYTQNQKVKDKQKKTNLDRYNYEYIFQSQRFKEKNKKYFLETFGFENPSQVTEFKNKRKQTTFKNFGNDYYFNTSDYQEKTLKTNIEKYGCRFPMQNSDFFERSKKNFFKTKPILKNDGTIVYLQGYEPVVYENLLKVFKEEEIECDSKLMPEITYEFQNKIRRYYPDFFIKHLSLVIEVKSTYTFKCDYEKNLAKKEAVEANGFNFEFIILEKDYIDEQTFTRIRNFGNI